MKLKSVLTGLIIVFLGLVPHLDGETISQPLEMIKLESLSNEYRLLPGAVVPLGVRLFSKEDRFAGFGTEVVFKAYGQDYGFVVSTQAESEQTIETRCGMTGTTIVYLKISNDATSASYIVRAFMKDDGRVLAEWSGDIAKNKNPLSWDDYKNHVRTSKFRSKGFKGKIRTWEKTGKERLLSNINELDSKNNTEDNKGKFSALWFGNLSNQARVIAVGPAHQIVFWEKDDYYGFNPYKIVIVNSRKKLPVQERVYQNLGKWTCTVTDYEYKGGFFSPERAFRKVNKLLMNVHDDPKAQTAITEADEE